MANTLKEWGHSSWNPLRCHGTELPPNLLLIAKLIIISHLAYAEWHYIKEPFLPFLTFFEKFRFFEFYPKSLLIIYIVSVGLIFFNRYVRAACFFAGLALLLSIISDRTLFHNHGVFSYFVLILIGLNDKRHRPWLLRFQIAIVYFGAGLNKILDADWLNGRYFQAWTHLDLKHGPYIWMASNFPPMLLSCVISWVTIALEFMIAFGLSIPRLYPLGIWLGIFLHACISLFTVDSGNLQGLFGFFFPVAVSTYLAFYTWPESSLIMEYNPKHRFSIWLNKIRNWIDFDRQFLWKPSLKSGAINQADNYLQLEILGKVYSDFKALKMLMLLSPITYIVFLSVFYFLIRILPYGANQIWGSYFIPYGAFFKSICIIVPIIFFFPLFESLAEFFFKKIFRRERFSQTLR